MGVGWTSCVVGAIAYLLWRLRDSFTTGMLFALYLVLTGTERLLVEFIRRNTEDSVGLTTAQLESLAMMIAGAVWIAIVIRRHGGIWRQTTNDVALRSAL